jgi:hypothetical protein
VRILEARFHPSSKTGRSVVSVGRVIWDGSRATIVPVNVSPTAVRPFDAARLREKLEFLVMSFPRDVCGGLLQLRSEFWSFVELPPSTSQNGQEDGKDGGEGPRAA